MVLRRTLTNPGLIAGFAAQTLQYGAGLILMPFVVSRLSAAEVGIWYVFLTIQSLVAIADFGFQPTLARFFSLATLGVKNLSQDGIGETGDGRPNIVLIRSLLHAGRRLYMGLATIVLALLCVGTLYVSDLAHRSALDPVSIQTAWLIFATAVGMNLYFMWIPAFLLGSGHVVANYVYLIFARGGFAVFGIVALLGGGSLLALAVAFFASQIVARLIAMRLLAGTIAVDGTRVLKVDSNAVFAMIWPNARRLGLVSIGAFLITRYNVLLLSSTVGLVTTASYAICLQLLSGIVSVSQLPVQASLPKIVAARVEKDDERLRKIVLRSAVFYWVLFFLATAVLLIAGQYFLDVIKSRVTLLDSWLLIGFAIVMGLEGFHSMAGFIITTKNSVPFVWPALLSGACIMASATAAIDLGYGVAGVIICQGLVQLAYNNWKWPLMVYRECRP
jgi:O-antigen/teichoic acid export membrane protein